MTPKVKVTAFQNASLLRKFTILFILMSFLPLGVLYYFYWQIRDQGNVNITESNFSLTLALLIIGVCIGYGVMRLVIKQIIEITEQNKKVIENVLGEEQIKDLENKNEIAVLARSFHEITSRLEDNVRKLELAKRTLHSVLAKVGSGLSSMQNIDSFLELIVETVSEALNAKIGVLFLLNEEGNALNIKAAYGVDLGSSQRLHIKMNEGTIGSVVKEKKPVLIPRLQYNYYGAPGGDLDFLKPPLLCAPLMLRDQSLGAIVVSGKGGDESFKEEELNLLFNLALQTAVAIENAKLNEDAEKTYFETVSALAMAVEAKDPYSRGHSDRVADYAVQIATKLNLPETTIKTLRDAARLHDIGKIGILDDILKKPSLLDPQEKEMMQKHPVIGASIIMPIRSLRNLCDVVRHHHEFLDGTGYPDGLKGDEVSLLTRVLTISDIYDALTTDRPYRKAFSHDQAKEEFSRMGPKIDQDIVKIFVQALESQGRD